MYVAYINRVVADLLACMYMSACVRLLILLKNVGDVLIVGCLASS